MRGVFLASFCAVTVGSGGCATVPPITERDYVKVADILYSVECELKEAVDYLGVYYSFAKEQLVQVNYALRVVETGSGSGNANLVVPISNGTFTIGFTGGLTRQATRDTNLTVGYETWDLECRPPDQSGTVPTRLEGGVGLYNWLLNATEALSKAKETPEAMSYRVDFDILAQASVNPRIAILKTSGRAFGADITLAGTRENLHSVQISVAQIKAGDRAAAKQRLDQEVQQFLLRNINN